MSSALTDADQDAGLRREPPLHGFCINPVGGQNIWAEGTDRFTTEAEAFAYARWARSTIATLRARATAAEEKLRDREAEIAALRAARNDEAAAMREACLKAALGASYGPPSSWPDEYPKGWRHPPSWEPNMKPTPMIAAWHDNGARDAWFAIRALAQPDSSQEPGTGGERDA